ncbi:MAG TPA: glucosidase [Pirellulales bacterium]|nr:glucosidase [Pirellulales bacterium]
MTREHQRLAEIRDDIYSWRRWGPYVSDRSWATVREDYSPDGRAWQHLTHDCAAGTAYRWGEDGIAGVCDRFQMLVFAPAFWNGRDPILKERLFGLTPFEGNHGEDVKEYYYYLDNTPTHSYMRFLYKYPQREFPYRLLVEENQRRCGAGFEYELVDTGVFDESRYFDIYVEYAKATPEDLCIRIEAFNRGPEPATLHILPHLWFRNRWSWTSEPAPEPIIEAAERAGDSLAIIADDAPTGATVWIPVFYQLGKRTLYGPSRGTPLFTDNETSPTSPLALHRGRPRQYVKDAFHRWLIHGEQCLNPQRRGTKAALHYVFEIPPGGSVRLPLRLTDQMNLAAPLADVDRIITLRRAETDEFYDSIHPTGACEEQRLIQRQALAGLLWTKQSYIFDVDRWLDGDDPRHPPPESRKTVRNHHWRHLNSLRVMTVPDKWEYPWFACWDLAFQCVTLALVDPEFAKEQLWVLLFEQFLHPNGQIPAYEWDFSDLNPPVHAWAVWRVYNMDRIRNGRPDRDFLERCFHKLLMNFAWWVNRADRSGNNIFEGGFLGLDNITAFDRSTKFEDGTVLEQSDATGWMGMFCLNLMRIALELAKENRVYEGLATKFFQHYVYVAAAMKQMGNRDYQLWDEEDGFFYDVLRRPDGSFQRFRVRSLVGLIPLFAVERLEEPWMEPFADFKGCFDWFMKNRADLVRSVVHTVDNGGKVTHVLTIVDQQQLVRLLDRVMDPAEFLSDYGVRSLSKAHQREPFVFGSETVSYEPAEACSKIKGGNSNWRGPIWLPTNFLLIESLRKLGVAFGDQLKLPLRSRDGHPATCYEMARQIAQRLVAIFERDASGNRPVFGGAKPFQHDPHWRDHLLFYEYFHGDNGAGIGASHQTGWTSLVASLIDEWQPLK